MTTLVIDASVALKWFIEEEGTNEAAALLHSPASLIAPDLVVAECLNAAWKAWRCGAMTAEQQDRAVALLPSLFDALVPQASLAPRAAVIARTLDHPAYDCLYLALAEQRAGTLVTADRRLLARIAGTPWSGLARSLYAAPIAAPAPARSLP